MKRILVLQHVANEIQGTLDPLLRERGVRMRYVNFGRDPDARPCIEGYHGLIVLGGPMGANESARHPHLDVEVALIERALACAVPVLGICLGAQLLARALGARVRPSPAPEIGWYDVAMHDAAREDPLFAHFGPVERLFQWHRDAFDLPGGARQLAATPDCPIQAFRYGDSAYGLQFHLEADPPLIARWLATPAYRAGLPDCVALERIAEETRLRAAPVRALAERAFSRFLDLGRPRPEGRVS